LANEPVLIDTSYWIEYFNRPGTQRAIAVEALIRDDRAALTGVILAELLQGTRTEEEFSELRSALAAVIWVETTRAVYSRAGRLGFELRRRGVTVPLTDCVVAATAESVGGRILTLDSHFEELAQIAPLILLSSDGPPRT
jgi:predicted nucleic acid-binding protein